MDNPPAALSVRNIIKRYGDHLVLPGVSLTVGPGDIVCLLGPSGCGKSTLAKIAASLLTPDEGTVTVNGQAVARPDVNRFMIFQEQDQIFPWKTALGNVALPLKLAGVPDPRVRAAAALSEVGLESAAGQYPHELSGGMRQRVALARAFAMRPSVLIMDEPFAGLDASRRFGLQDLLVRLIGEHSQSVLFVTHEIDEAIRLADRIVVMAGDGTLANEHLVPTKRPRDARTPEGSKLAHTLFEQLSGRST
jgi:NitT/TauT family transport system ATP-binding protein